MSAQQLRATVATAPASGYCTVRFDGGTTPAPAKVSPAVTGLVVGSRVDVEMAGRRPVIVRRR